MSEFMHSLEPVPYMENKSINSFCTFNFSHIIIFYVWSFHSKVQAVHFIHKRFSFLLIGNTLLTVLSVMHTINITNVDIFWLIDNTLQKEQSVCQMHIRILPDVLTHQIHPFMCILTWGQDSDNKYHKCKYFLAD